MNPMIGLAIISVLLMGTVFTAEAIGPGGVVNTNNGAPGELPGTVMKGYILTIQRIKTGEHFERYGWTGGEFTRVVSDFTEVTCCLKTNRAMDGCTGFKICDSQL